MLLRKPLWNQEIFKEFCALLVSVIDDFIHAERHSIYGFNHLLLAQSWLQNLWPTHSLILLGELFLGPFHVGLTFGIFPTVTASALTEYDARAVRDVFELVVVGEGSVVLAFPDVNDPPVRVR